jgi:hypothetical protein
VATKKQNNRSNGAGNSNSRSDWQGFADIRLTPEDKEIIREELLPTLDPVVELSNLVVGGYKVSIAYDQRTSGWFITMTGKTNEDGNLGWSLTGRGGSLESALASLLYKHFNIAKGGSWAAASEQNSTFIDFG